jgi:hypothetical protein
MMPIQNFMLHRSYLPTLLHKGHFFKIIEEKHERQWVCPHGRVMGSSKMSMHIAHSNSSNCFALFSAAAFSSLSRCLFLLKPDIANQTLKEGLQSHKRVE